MGTAPLQNPPLWPYTLYFRMPHKCHGNLQNCPTRPLAVWEIVMNELDRREDPTVDEELAGCAMVDSCSNIRSGDQFYNFLTHNFYRHFDQNRAPLGLFFHSSWLKNNLEFLDAFLYWIDEVLANHPEVYFVTQTQVIQWIQDPVTIEAARNFPAWQEKCSPGPRTECLVPNSSNLPTTRSFLDNSSSCTPVQGAQINIHGRMTLLERVSFKFEILNFSLCINLPNTLYLRCGV